MMPIGLGDPIVLLDLKKGRRKNIIVEDKVIKIKGFGVFNPKDFTGKEYGDIVYLGNKPVLLQPPSVVECIKGLKRKAQIILPKDSGLIALYANVGPGSIVVEGGIGSGGLTIVLANFVRPTGKVISYDINEEFFKIAYYNLRVVGLHEYVDMKLKDIKEGIDESNVDAVVLDIPEPWDVVEHARNALKPFGHFVAYVPTIEQARKTYLELKNQGFYNLEIVELLMRNILVKPLGTRPDNKVIGHTGYIIAGRKLRD
ncbi:MAG TPA: tRNA (adenine-N1)-methyltransferase [Euryarchaeota archaeon]|nr:tRNA (adenine-N1)-methyltransferase [Euryarchaeota archaeon]